MEQIGTVVALEGDFAKVQVQRQSACGENCATCKGGCASGLQTVFLAAPAGLAVGDRVQIGSNTAAVLLLGFITYLLPLILTAVFCSIFQTDKAAFFSLLLSFALCAVAANGLSKKKGFKSRIVKIL